MRRLSSPVPDLRFIDFTPTPLTVDGIPLLQDFFVKNMGKVYAYDFLVMLLKFYWPTFKKVKALAAPGSCHLTYSLQKIAIFEVFRAYVREGYQYINIL